MLSDLSVILQPFRTESGAHWWLNLNIMNPRGGATIKYGTVNMLIFCNLIFLGEREGLREEGRDGRRDGRGKGVSE